MIDTMIPGRQGYVIINERITMFHWGVWHEKEKKELTKPAGSHPGKTKTGIPPEHSVTAIDVQPLPGREGTDSGINKTLTSENNGGNL